MTEQRPDWVPGTVDLDKPSAARMYDYYLGGWHNFAADRALAQKMIDAAPDLPAIMRSNRAFLGRAIRYLASQGVRQFIDIGSGIPTQGNVHEIAQLAAPGARVLYVDHDPVAVAHSELLLGAASDVRILRADLRDLPSILNSAERRELIDLDQPVAVLMLAMMHFVPETDSPEKILDELRAALAPGSYLVMSHGTAETRPEAGEQATQLYQAANDQLTWRSRARVRQLFEGWEMVEPGMVWLALWRPESPEDVGEDPSSSATVAVVARKPAS